MQVHTLLVPFPSRVSPIDLSRSEQLALVWEQHAELYPGEDGRVISVSCRCPIGRDHDYDEWQAKVGSPFGGPR